MVGILLLTVILLSCWGIFLWIEAVSEMNDGTNSLWMLTPFWIFMPSLFNKKGNETRVKAIIIIPIHFILILMLVVIRG